MNQNADTLIKNLESEINKKCCEIKQAKREAVLVRFFIALCIAAVIIPTLFVAFGISLISLIIPLLFTSLSFFYLSPILINQGRNSNEKI